MFAELPRATVRHDVKQAVWHSAGYTLVEILVVVAILGLLVTLTLTRGPLRSASLELRLASDSVAQTLRMARARAMASNAPTAIVFDTAAFVLRLNDGTTRRMPPGTAVTVTTNAGSVAGPLGEIWFRPDGSSNGGEVALSQGRLRAKVGVNWLTGQVSVAAGF